MHYIRSVVVDPIYSNQWIKSILIRGYSTFTEINTSDLHQIASSFNSNYQRSRQALIEKICARLSIPTSSNEQLEKYQRLHHRLLFRQLKIDPEIEAKHRHGTFEFKIPFMHELTSDEWILSQGPEMLRHALQHYHVIGDILNEESLSSIKFNFLVKYGPRPKDVGQRGNIIEPSKIIHFPTSINCPLKDSVNADDNCSNINNHKESVDGDFHSKHYSIIWLDCDYPDEKLGRKVEFIHWMKSDFSLSSFPLLIGQSGEEENKGKEIYPFIPPHPFRGTGYHRYLWLLLERDIEGEKIEDAIDPFISEHSLLFTVPITGLSQKKRVLNTHDFLLSTNSHKLVGVALCRSTWSKSIPFDQILQHKDQPVFGIPVELFKTKETHLFKYA